MPENPTPRAAMTPISTINTPRDAATTPAGTSPASDINTMKGTATSANARPVAHAATNLPVRI